MDAAAVVEATGINVEKSKKKSGKLPSRTSAQVIASVSAEGIDVKIGNKKPTGSSSDNTTLYAHAHAEITGCEAHVGNKKA